MFIQSDFQPPFVDFLYLLEAQRNGHNDIDGMLEFQDLCPKLEIGGWWSKDHAPQFKKLHDSMCGSRQSTPSWTTKR